MKNDKSIPTASPSRPPYRGRLAPSPTGLLHLGHGRTFYIAWQRAQEKGGEIVLRIEDLDPQRSKKESLQTILDDFKWMGIDWTGEVLYQSQRYAAYLSAWNSLKANGHIYPCHKSRKDIRMATMAPHEEYHETVFPTEWRAPSSAAESYPSPEGAHWRFRVPDGRAITFIDAEQGPQSFIAGEDFGDFVVWRNDDIPAYELAVVVDDIETQITEVVRGKDLLLSTARQILVYEALGKPIPQFCHLPLVCDVDGVRLAKRSASISLQSFREQNISYSDAIRNINLSFE